MEECLTRDPEAAGLSLTGFTALYIYPSFVLVQPRKTHLCLTERLLMGRIESNQINKPTDQDQHCFQSACKYMLISQNCAC